MHGETAQRQVWVRAGVDLTLGRLWLVAALDRARLGDWYHALPARLDAYLGEGQ